jgi:uncharacterized protein
MESKAHAYIQTFTNKKFHILDPRSEEIDLYDLAHALALQCRFTGHTRHHYSIAQHVVLASHVVHPGFELETLHHDDSEAYIGDMSRPFKHFTSAGTVYREVETAVQDACDIKFGIHSGQMSPEVKWADNAMLYSEKAQLMKNMEWDTQWGDGDEAVVKIHYWFHWYAEMRYLHRHWQLTEGNASAIWKSIKWIFWKVFDNG